MNAFITPQISYAPTIWMFHSRKLNHIVNNIYESSLIFVCKYYNSSFNDIFRSSRPDVFCKEGVLRNFAKFTVKQMCQSLIFNTVAGLRPATLLKKRLWHRCFSVNFAKFLRTPFLTEHLRWLLLDIGHR